MYLRCMVFVLSALMVSPFALFARRPFPASSYDSLKHRSVHIFSDQLHGGLTDAEARFVAQRYVGVQKMRLPDIRRIRSFNPDFLHLHYKLSITVDTLSSTIIKGEWTPGSSPLSNWSEVKKHPDWILKNSAGERVIHNNERYILDIGNPEVLDWWAASCIDEMQGNECDGVFADTYTIEAIFGRTNYSALFDNVSNTSSNWVPKLNNWGQKVFAKLDSAGLYFFPNIDNLQTNWVESAGAHYYKGDYMHGAMLETWGGWSSAEDAQQAILRVRNIQSKGVYLHAQGYYNEETAQASARQRMWLTGTYLLTNIGRLYLTLYGPGDVGAVGNVLWYPEFELDLGPWKSEWQGLSQLIWNTVLRREYQKGWVLCNVSASARNVALPDTMYLAEDDGSTTQYWADPATGAEKVSLKYTPVTSVSMPAMSAAVVFFEKPAPTCTMSLPGDFDGNGVLGVPDVVALIRALRDKSTDPCLDINGDGKAGMADVLSLLISAAKAH